MDTSDLLQSIETQTSPDPQWTVLWLHGLGADGNDFVPIVPELVQPGWPGLRFVFPHAPERMVTINNGARMRAWFDIRDANLANRADEAGVEQSLLQVQALIDREAERGIPASRLVLAGFSQGAAITLAMGLRRREPLAGLVALSGYLPMIERAASVVTPQAIEQPLFMAHGTQDPVVPYMAGEYSAAALRRLGFSVDWHRYPMAHAVCAEQVRDLTHWLGQRFAAG